MEQQETWDTLYRRKHQEQHDERSARERYQHLRQEIADLSISFFDKDGYQPTQYFQDLKAKVKELRALEQQYPSVKEEM
jgi:hypothetical protein